MQPPETETNVRPGGVGSARLTLSACDGPLLKTSISKSAKPPAPAATGAYLLTERSVLAAEETVVTAMAVLLVSVVSDVVVVHDVVLVSVGLG